jgi:hypothetical protein
MSQIQKTDKTQHAVVAETNTLENDNGPVLQWNFKFNEQTGKNEFDSIELSDGSKLDAKSLKTALKKTTGTSDLKIGEKILGKVSYGMSAEKHDTRINEASTLLPALRPKNETEALLLGQFLALHDSGMKCLRLANLQDSFYHEERLFILANKLLNTANQTMQTVLKYRSGGQQIVQVLHVHNEGQAIVAQNLSSQPRGEGSMEKIMN